ncbi:MAG TPA: 1,2-phenylacetyl-CoA epoxidase subunit PaaC [Chitinophagaceae bacterium]
MSKQALIDYTLHLADNTLILGQRNSEWTGHGPILEQDIALSNIALDLIGQARMLYQYAAELKGGGATEDSLAYLRDAWDFNNCLLVELDKGDWAKTILRQFFFSTYQWYLYLQLQNSPDAQLAAIAGKALKEVAYHLRWSGEWVVRLGDGTEESHRRIADALANLWPYTGELTIAAPYEQSLAVAAIGVDPSSFKNEWLHKISEVLKEATLPLPPDGWMQTGGKEGKHTEHLGYVLAEMQYLQRAYPGAEW